MNTDETLKNFDALPKYLTIPDQSKSEYDTYALVIYRWEDWDCPNAYVIAYAQARYGFHNVVWFHKVLFYAKGNTLYNAIENFFIAYKNNSQYIKNGYWWSGNTKIIDFMNLDRK